MDKIKYLSRINLFQDLDMKELQQMESIAPILVTKKGTLITAPNKSQKRLYLIKCGKVRMYTITNNGKELTIDVLGVGHIFGEISLFAPGSHLIYAKAIEDSVICSIDKVQFEQIIIEKPDIALKIIKILSTRLKEMEEMLELMAYGSVRNKLLFLLNRLTEKFGEPLNEHAGVGPEWIQLGVKVTHQELASMMGSIRETVTELLNELTSEGVVNRTSTRGFFIIHRQRLKETIESTM
ncbi:Crp/Fnr family transcriptional regulator [Cytobacillus solani]|uniref:Transcriptional regulator n=1 Tax=Cytobacillus solani TaxID=1637975 RepID=A0A0Q3QTF0_9BACI|nr:Crp/Fnr family transcriptional regulator [Cytobacillus solani]KOP84109.1 transcriptional regulator [Bacillus sp. FJAT-21945]KQL20998.1 transcriptional regulator [Cytobacillus solani]USK54236.1 Crp/Fnr family transcriptional regulator [Cytobacillus solani]